MAVTLYGIKNCDTVKKARKWLDTNAIEYVFHDFRVDGLDEKQIKTWIKDIGVEQLVNKRGTTWRKLPEQVKESLDKNTAVALIKDNPTLIKRPVLQHNKNASVGFDEARYKALFN